MGAVYILWVRELKRYVRSRAQIVASLGQPLLYCWPSDSVWDPSFKNPGMAATCSLWRPG